MNYIFILCCEELKVYYTRDNFKGSSVKSTTALSHAKKVNPMLLLSHST